MGGGGPPGYYYGGTFSGNGESQYGGGYMLNGGYSMQSSDQHKMLFNRMTKKSGMLGELSSLGNVLGSNEEGN